MNAPIPGAGSKSVAVIGAGNIGSHLLPLIARMPAVGLITIVDHDGYEEKNLVSQGIGPADVGLPKAIRQMVRLRRDNPWLRVKPVVGRVENVPWGALRAGVIASCLDSRISRRVVNEIAWRLGVPLVDAGVQPDGMLARIRVYRPGADCACVECGWDQHDYGAERESSACDGRRIEAAPTNAPSSLGALAAAMQAVEIGKILGGEWERVAVACEMLIDANLHRHFVTLLPRNPACRFDHQTLSVQPSGGAPGSTTLGELFAPGAGALRVGGQVFARQWACALCGTMREIFGLRDRIADSALCEKCGQPMHAIGFHTLGRLRQSDVPEGAREARLVDLGFREGDIFTAETDGAETHFELSASFGEQA